MYPPAQNRGENFHGNLKMKSSSINLILSIKTHVSTRRLEWLMALIIFNIGLYLIEGTSTFEVHPLFSTLSHIPFEDVKLNERVWAIAFLLIGGIRLLILTLNGLYLGRFSAVIRCTMSALSFVLISALIIGFKSVSNIAISPIILQWLAFGELTNIWQASYDIHLRKRDA